MSRVGHDQMKKLLDLLSEDGVLINGKVAYNNTNRQAFWKRVSIQLNSVDGGVYKNTWKWCKMWADWKNKTKKKANVLLRRKNFSFGQPCPALSPLEKRLLKLINYQMDDKAQALSLATVSKKEVIDSSDDYEIDCIEDNITEQNNEEKSSSEDEEKTSEHDTKFCDVDNIKEDKSEDTEESSDVEYKARVKVNGVGGKKRSKKKKISLEEYKLKTTLMLEKNKVEQKNEELRLKALELKLKGDELRLKEIEMTKINYLTNIEEEKLKCFRDISASLKELLENNRTGSSRFHNVIT